MSWLLAGDPALQWQVERDLLDAPPDAWLATRARTASEGFAAKLLSLQDSDGQWAGGAYFPSRAEPRALVREDDEDGQPFIATTWSLNALREWGVEPAVLGDTAAQLEVGSRWEYDDLPYWGGEADCCINAYTLANGAWLGVDVSALADWFIQHQLDDGGWNCEWVEGSIKSSFDSTLNSLIGLLDYEIMNGRDASITEARHRGEEYLLQRRLMFGLTSGEPLGAWVTQFSYPFRWHYSSLRALNYFRDAGLFDERPADARLADAAESVRASANAHGRWCNQRRDKGSVWFDVDAAVGEESRWLTFYALRALHWWSARPL